MPHRRRPPRCSCAPAAACALRPAFVTSVTSVAYVDQLAALLPLFERVSGPEHPSTLTARAELAYWTGEAGDAARDQYAALLPVCDQVLGASPHSGCSRQPRPLDGKAQGKG